MIYLIPGLGAGEKLFEPFDFTPYKTQVIPFLIPEKNETLPHYSRRMAEAINPREAIILIGVSFGGIIAQEIARWLPVKKIILISSITAAGERAAFFRWLRIFPLHEIMPLNTLKRAFVLASELFTRKSPDERRCFRELVMASDSRVVRWGITQVMKWNPDYRHPHLIRIHGTHDLLFPLKKIKAEYVIQGGQHFMIMRETGEINRLLLHLLKEETSPVSSTG